MCGSGWSEGASSHAIRRREVEPEQEAPDRGARPRRWRRAPRARATSPVGPVVVELQLDRVERVGVLGHGGAQRPGRPRDRSRDRSTRSSHQGPSRSSMPGTLRPQRPRGPRASASTRLGGGVQPSTGRSGRRAQARAARWRRRGRRRERGEPVAEAPVDHRLRRPQHGHRLAPAPRGRRRAGAASACVSRPRRRWVGRTPTSVTPATGTSPPGTVSRREKMPVPATIRSPSRSTSVRSGSSTRSQRSASSSRGVVVERRPTSPRRTAGTSSGCDRRRLHGRQLMHTPAPCRSGSSPARARTRCRASRAPGPSRWRPPWGEALVSRGDVRGRRGAAHLAPRRGPPRGSRTTSRTARTSRRWPTLGADGVLAVTVCGAVDPAVELGSLVCFDDLHFLANRLGDGELCTFFTEPGDARARALDLRGPVLGAAARARCSTARREAGVRDARRRLLRPRRRAALQHARRDPRARGLRRHRGVADRRARRPCCAARPSCPYALLGYLTDYANGVHGGGDAGRRR